MDIKQALAQLDPANDSQWTSDGLPVIAVVSDLVGVKVTRKQITEAAPEFIRETASAPAVAAEQTADDDGGETPAVVEQESAWEPQAADEPIDELAAAERAVADAERALADAKRALDAAQRRRDKIILARERAGQNSNSSAIRAYIDRSNAERAAAVEQQRALNDLLAGKKAGGR